MTAPRAPASLSAHIIPSDIRLGRFVLRPSGQPDSEGRFRWALHGPGSMGVVRRFTHTYTVAIATVATEAADRSGLDLGLDRVTVTTPAPVEVPMPPKPVPALKVKPNPSAKACRIVGCNYPPRTRGVCQEHYDQARHAGVRDEVCLPSSIKPAPKVAAVKAGEAVAKAPKVEPDTEFEVLGTKASPASVAIWEVHGPLRDALDVNKALPDGHPGHAIRRAIREAGAAGVAALEEASRLRAELTAIVTSSGVRIEGAEDLEPVEAVRQLVAALTPREPTTVPEILIELDRNGQRHDALHARMVLLRRREAIATERAEVEAERVRAEARLRELAEEEARLSA